MALCQFYEDMNAGRIAAWSIWGNLLFLIRTVDSSELIKREYKTNSKSLKCPVEFAGTPSPFIMRHTMPHSRCHEETHPLS